MHLCSVNIIILLVFGIFVPWVSSERVLFLAPLGSKSHKIFFMAITEALAKRGHHVTVVSGYKPFKTIPNVREIMVRDMNLDNILNTAFDKPESAIMKLILESPRMCSDSLAQHDVQSLKKEKFDLIIISFFMNYCYLAFVDHFKVPFIYALSAGLIDPFSAMTNNLEFPSFLPNKMLEAQFPFGFKDRMSSTVLNTVFTFAMEYTTRKALSVCKERNLCPADMPPISEINKNISLVIINSVKSMEQPPRPVLPNIIYAGAVHIKPAKKLPQDLENWASESGTDGFIFFSLGSALNPSLLPENNRKILVSVFGSLKQRVLWKWHEDTMPDLPPNVKLGKWFPQQDILGHPKLKLFITHGGYSSTQESIYNNVPILGMPVFADQFYNLKEAKKEGWADVMKWDELEENKLRKLILDTMSNKSMKDVLARQSNMMKDVPISPEQEVGFWVEYVIRHKGAPHLRSPIADMKWYQVYNIDVWATIVGLMFGLIYLVFIVIRSMVKLCLPGTPVPKSKKKKQ